MLRGQVNEITKKQAKDTVVVNVRAVSKLGAMTAARISSLSYIPIREQKISNVRNISNDRVFDQWEVEVQDLKKMDNLGR